MKARVIETGEIINVSNLYPVTYSRLDCNGKIIEEYDEDELEIIYSKPKEKFVKLSKVEEFLSSVDLNFYEWDEKFNTDELIADLEKYLEE